MSSIRLGVIVAFLCIFAGVTHRAQADLWGSLKAKLEAARKTATEKAREAAKSVAGALSGAGRAIRDAAVAIARAVRDVVGLSDKLQKNLAGFFAELAENAALIVKVLRIVREYPAKLAQLRAMRARPPPIQTGFDPSAALSPAGKEELARKAAAYEKMTNERHFFGHILVKSAELHPTSHAVVSYPGSIGDASYHSGQALAARAYKYGVTGAVEDLELVRRSLAGVYNLLTLASAPAGRIVNPRTGAPVTPRAGLAVRGYAEEGAPLFRGNGDLDPQNPHVYRYEGKLFGLEGQKFLFLGDVSRDQMDGLLFGVAAAVEVLAKRNAEPEWRRRIGDAARAFALELVRNGYKIIDLSGKMTTFGDQSKVSEPTTLMQNLSWLKTAALASNAPDVKAAFERLAGTYLRGPAPVVYKIAQDALLGPVLRNHREVLQYVIADFNYNLLMLTAHPLIRHETSAARRRAYVDFLAGTLWPLLGDLRVPFFDFIYMLATGKRDLLGRAAAVLRQYRNPPAPFGNPGSATELVTDFSDRTELHDPLFFYLRTQWDTEIHKQIAGRENPFGRGGSAWALGPGLVPRDNNVERGNPYLLRGYQAYGDGSVDGKPTLKEHGGHDYLLSYWFARYHGLL